MPWKLRVQSPPCLFLLYTEWVLLGTCGALAIVEAFQKERVPIQHILILLLLWVLGLRFPTHLGAKILYTGVQMGAIFYGAAMGYLHILPMFYVITTIRSCFLFPAIGRWTIAGMSLLLFLGHRMQRLSQVGIDLHSRMHLMNETLMFAFCLFLSVQLCQRLIAERELRETEQHLRQEVECYAQQAEQLAVVQERNRIARNIHDALGHTLCTLSAQLQAAVELRRHQSEPDQIYPFLDIAYDLSRTAMNDVRTSVGLLREGGHPSLQESLSSLVEQFERIGITVTLKVETSIPIPLSLREELYRIVQEALTNIYKHADTTEASVTIMQSTSHLHVTIQDNGRGFDLTQPTTGYGLQGIKERVEILGGQFAVLATIGQGCRIQVHLPLWTIGVLCQDDSLALSR